MPCVSQEVSRARDVALATLRDMHTAMDVAKGAMEAKQDELDHTLLLLHTTQGKVDRFEESMKERLAQADQVRILEVRQPVPLPQHVPVLSLRLLCVACEHCHRLYH